MSENRDYALILSSGGIDSTACIHFYKKIHFEVEAIFVDYGQLAKDKELASVTSVAKYYDIDLKTVKISNNIEYNNGLVLGRNAALYFISLMNFTRKNGIISSGVHKGTPYYDCSGEFINQMQYIFDGYVKGAIKIEAPFLKFDKGEIWDYCHSESVPLPLTYSCERGKDQPCGLCTTCKDLEKLYASKK